MALKKRRPLPQLDTATWRRKAGMEISEVQSIYPLGWGLPYLFGNGSDGNVTLGAGTTSIASCQIKQYKNLSIPAGATLTTTETQEAVLIIYVQERCTIAGTVSMDAKGGIGTAGIGPSGGSGSNPTSYTNAYGGSGGGGGGSNGGGGNYAGGGGGNTVATGGAAGITPTYAGSAGNAISYYSNAKIRMDPLTRAYALSSWGAGGGNGGAYNSVSGSGGKGGGGIIFIAKELVIAASGVVTSDGANGSSPVGGESGGGGGGGGGFIYFITARYSNAGSVAAAAGSGVAGTGATGGAGAAGGAGTIIVEELT